MRKWRSLEENEETRFCLRCQGLAVIDRGFLLFLPGVLNRAAEMLPRNSKHSLELVDQEEVESVRQALRQYAILLGSIPDE